MATDDTLSEGRGPVTPSRFRQEPSGYVHPRGRKPEQGRIRPGCALCGWKGIEQDAAQAKQSFQRHRARAHGIRSDDFTQPSQR